MSVRDTALAALAWIAPSAAVRRAHALDAIGSARQYDGAMRGRRGASFNAGNGSANTALGPALEKLRERSSDLVRNTWIGARMLDVLTGHTVGTGITVVWKDSRAQDLWDDWIQDADIEGERDFAGDQVVAFRSMLERGDSGIRFVTRRLDAGSKRRVPLKLQVSEGDCIDLSRDGMMDQKRSRLGVHLGDWNERLGYWLHREHPGEQSLVSSLMSAYVPRADFCHLYRPLRAGLVRGVPLLAPVIMTTRDWSDLMDAMVVKARMEACYGLIINSKNAAQNLAGVKPKTDDRGRKVEAMSPGMIYRGENGEEVQPFSPSGSGQFEPVSLAALMGIASGGMVTYDQLTGDMRRANYSSMRAPRIEFRRLIEQQQWTVLVPFLMRRVTDRFVETAILAGLLRDRKTPYQREYVMPANEPLDPMKDMQADILAVRSGRMTWSHFCASWGVDPKKQLDDIEAWMKDLDGRMDGKGLVLDSDPRRALPEVKGAPKTAVEEIANVD